MAAHLITDKRLLTHYCNKLDTIISRFKGEELETLNVGAAQGESASQYTRESLQRLSEAIGALDTVTHNIKQTMTEYATKFTELDYPTEKDKQDFEEYSAKAEKALISATDYLLVLKARIHAFIVVKAEPQHNQHSGSVQVQTTSQPSHERLDLPTLPVPIFQGNIWEWDNFWELFNENVHSRDIPELCKFNYLLQALRGDALALIKKFQVAKGNYSKAIEFLQHKYGDRDELVTHLIEKLGKCHLHSASIRDQRTLFEQLQVIIMQLRQKEVQVDNQWMYQQVLTKFPDTVQRKVLVRKQAAKNSGVSFNLDMLIQYLEEEISTDEMLAVYMKNAKPDPTPTKPDRRRSDRIKTYLGTCMYCEGRHKPADCKKYSTPQERSDYLRDNKLCLICASAQHSTANCKKRMCFRCGEPHHTSYCFKGDTTADQGALRKTSPPLSEGKKSKARDTERHPTRSEARKVNAVGKGKFRQKANPAPKLQSHERNDSSAKWEAACTMDDSVDVLSLLTSSAQPGEKETTRQAAKHALPDATKIGARALSKRAALPKPRSNAAKGKISAVKCRAAVPALAQSLRPTPEAKNTRHEYKKKPHTRCGTTLQTAPIHSLLPDAPSPNPEAKAPALMAFAVLAPYPEQSEKPRTTPVSLKPDEALSTDEEREDITLSVTSPSKPGASHQTHESSPANPMGTQATLAAKSFKLMVISNIDFPYQSPEEEATTAADQLGQSLDNTILLLSSGYKALEEENEDFQRQDVVHSSSVTAYLLEVRRGETPKITPCLIPTKVINRNPTCSVATQTTNHDTRPNTSTLKDVVTQTQPSYATAEQVAGRRKTTAQPIHHHKRTNAKVQTNDSLEATKTCFKHYGRQLNEPTVKATRVHRQRFEFHDKHPPRREKQSQPMDKSAYATIFPPYGSHPHMAYGNSESPFTCEITVQESPPLYLTCMDHCRQTARGVWDIATLPMLSQDKSQKPNQPVLRPHPCSLCTPLTSVTSAIGCLQVTSAPAIPYVLPSSDPHMSPLLSTPFLGPAAPHSYHAPNSNNANANIDGHSDGAIGKADDDTRSRQ